ncbi:MAG: FixH family protein [Chloroflexi bacterium]|nr:FixH family protein [Chloroflexota bacterium]
MMPALLLRQRSPRHTAAALIVAGLLASLAACGGRGPSTTLPAVAPPQPGEVAVAGADGRGSADAQMALQMGGLLLPVANGMRVPAGGGLAAELFFAPYPPAGRSTLDVYVLNERTAEPLADVEVSLRYEMPGMEHGVAVQRATARGDGHYLLPLNLTMAGNWQLAVQLSRPGQRGEIVLITTTRTVAR